jgi:subtilase family serine protease
MKGIFAGFFVGIVMLAASAVLFPAATYTAPQPRAIDNNDTVVLRGNVHPLTRPEFDTGPSDPSLPMERMILSLRLSSARQAELDRLLTELHDPASSNYHQWLTPEEFGLRFGPSQDDIDAITGWLVAGGFVVDEVAKGRLWINFSGPVVAVDRAFHTEIHDYYVNGRLHHANDRDPSIPRALSDLVAGVVSLHDFPLKMMHSAAYPVEPDYTDANGAHWLAPGDFAIIYDVNALYSAGINGSGQSIAIVGRTHPSTAASDWAAFRSTMGLPANAPHIIVNGPDPGDQGTDEDFEANLDVEWSGGVAQNASILFVTSKSTSSTDGVDLSAEYIVDNNLAAVMSTSFGECEQDLGTSENAFYNGLWLQAASQGITSFVSSGDSGAAGCDADTDSSGNGLGVNGLASTPYNVAVGGTEFNEGSGTYWNATNGTGDVSVISYIPEIAWNQSGDVSGGSGLLASGGGASTIYAKPAWQAAPGVPSGNYRYVPDVALSAATHDAYLVVQQGDLYGVGGTSASSPSFAGLMALVVQKRGQRQGNANVELYQIGNAQYNSKGTVVFHDVTSGNNSVPGVTGYSCTTGYDPVTGLGSVDASALVNAETLFPGSPTKITVAVGNGQATVYFTAPASSGGSSITSYTVTAYLVTNGTVTSVAATATGASSPITVTGLVNADTYIFTVTATNSYGTGPASAASSSVTIGATPAPAIGPWGFLAAVIGLGGFLARWRRHL